MSIVKTKFGTTYDGKDVYMYELRNSKKMVAKIIDYGAILVSLIVPNRNDELADVVLGYDDLEKYFDNATYFGSTIGRNSNRISKGKFSISGVEYTIEKNDAVNNLHSGFNGYNKRLWDAKVNEDNNEVTFHLFSPDGDQGFPGNFDVYVTYTLTENNELKIKYNGKSDKTTIANMTNHSYFNLAGHNSGNIYNHKLWLKASKYTPVSKETFVPTGEIADVTGTPMDFTSGRKLGDEINSDFSQIKYANGYDHNYVLDVDGNKLEKVAILSEDSTDRTMEVYTDCVGLQLYTSNSMGDKPLIGKEHAEYTNRSAVCLETQYFPNAINENNFKKPLIRPNEEYKTMTVYKFV